MLVGMLRALDRAKNPQGTERAAGGAAWLQLDRQSVRDGGVVIALELSLGAVVAGPFDIAERELSSMIARVDCGGARDRERPVTKAATSPTIH